MYTGNKRLDPSHTIGMSLGNHHIRVNALGQFRPVWQMNKFLSTRYTSTNIILYSATTLHSKV